MSQSEKILDYLQQGNTLTPIEALEKFQCFRLAARCNDLRKDGHKIQSEIVKEDNKRYARYSI
jgi:hypothetical protein